MAPREARQNTVRSQVCQVNKSDCITSRSFDALAPVHFNSKTPVAPCLPVVTRCSLSTCTIYSFPEQGHTRREAGTQSFRSEAPQRRQIAGLPAGPMHFGALLPSTRRRSRRHTLRVLRQVLILIGPNMRICGSHIVLLMATSLALAACNGEESAGDTNPGSNLPPII